MINYKKRHFPTLSLLWWSFLCVLIGNQTICYANDKPPIRVLYGGIERQDYYVELLQLALSYPTGAGYQLQASGLNLPKQRAFDLMNAHQGIDVLFGSISKTRLQQYSGIPFNILKGYNGWRVALINKTTPDILRGIHSKQHLRRLIAGQFLTWSDTQILRANDLTIDTSTELEGLYRMLERKRIDYFPLSVLEINHLLDQHPNSNLMIDPHILIFYPTATWFYVAKDNEALAAALLTGLQQAQRDGSFDALFQRHFGAALSKLKLDTRTKIVLYNPLLPETTNIQ
jgi:hypothetical protein